MSENTSICDGPRYTCGDSKNAVTEWDTHTTLQQVADKKITMRIGETDIPIWKRVRDYIYIDVKTTHRYEYFYIVSTHIQNAVFDCFKTATSLKAKIKESYETTDCTFYYADLRNDLLIYKESTQKMEFEKDNGKNGVTVKVRTSFDTAYLAPFIMESVPISIYNRFICTGIGVLHEENIHSGYWDGIRILMPLFNDGMPYGDFDYEGQTLNAADIDWYFLPGHREKDGDQFFWWADWHKAVGEHNAIDAREAELMWGIVIGNINSGLVQEPATNGVAVAPFSGSAAKDRVGNLFLSAKIDLFGGGAKLVSRLLIDGADTPIPTDCECDVWFPVAPI